MKYIEDIDISKVKINYTGKIDLVEYIRNKIREEIAKKENSLYLD